MIEHTNDIFEIGVDPSNSNILYRIFRLYKYYLLFFPLGFIVVSYLRVMIFIRYWGSL